MTPLQLECLKTNLTHIRSKFPSFTVVNFRHGCCAGSDIQAAILARDLGFYIIGHPGIDNKGVVRSNLTKFDNVTVKPERFLDRNHNIVRESDILFAAPAQEKETLRSGTWATVRFARTLEVNVIILFPDGKVMDD